MKGKFPILRPLLGFAVFSLCSVASIHAQVAKTGEDVPQISENRTHKLDYDPGIEHKRQRTLDELPFDFSDPDDSVDPADPDDEPTDPVDPVDSVDPVDPADSAVRICALFGLGVETYLERYSPDGDRVPDSSLQSEECEYLFALENYQTLCETFTRLSEIDPSSTQVEMFITEPAGLAGYDYWFIADLTDRTERCHRVRDPGPFDY